MNVDLILETIGFVSGKKNYSISDRKELIKGLLDVAIKSNKENK